MVGKTLVVLYSIVHFINIEKDMKLWLKKRKMIRVENVLGSSF